MNNNLSCENFVKIMDTLNRYQNYEYKLAELNVNIWENEAVNKLINNYVGLVKLMLNDYNNWIDIFRNDCEWGANPNITLDDGSSIRITSLEDVYNLIEDDNKEE